MSRFEQSYLIPAEAGRVFDLHLDPNNLKKLLPKSFHPTLLSYRLPLHTGSILAIDCRYRLLSWLWEVEIDTIEAEKTLRYHARQSPFGYWAHTISFEQNDQGTRLSDTIEYRVPFFPIGLLLEPFIRAELNRVAKQRAEAIKALLVH